MQGAQLRPLARQACRGQRRLRLNNGSSLQTSFGLRRQRHSVAGFLAFPIDLSVLTLYIVHSLGGHSMRTIKMFRWALLVAWLAMTATVAQAQFVARDPGVRGGPAGAGGPISGLSDNQREFFEVGLEDFLEDEEVDEGLGPRFNSTGCGGCHSQPDIGGSSPFENPQVDVADEFNNNLPS